MEMKRIVSVLGDDKGSVVSAREIAKSGGSAVLIQKTITDNGTFAAADDNADGYSSVTVDVPQFPGSSIEFQNIEWNAGKRAYMATKAVVHGSRILANMLSQYFPGAISALADVTAANFRFADAITYIEPYAAYYSALVPVVDFPECTSIGRNAFEAGGSSTYQKVTTVNLPKVTKLLETTFKYQLSMTAAQIGSVGHPVTIIANTAFDKCTQSGLTITVYVDDNTSIPLANAPWGAANATIVYRSATSGEVRT